MNYLAHLFLARPNPPSRMGNLLGDFCKGVDLSCYPQPVLEGLENHRLVDRFTDSHPLVKRAKRRFSPERRRFAGIAMDVLFDHFLLRHWQNYSDLEPQRFFQLTYSHLDQALPDMPPRMQKVVASMLEHNWLLQYQTLDGVGYALDRIAGRIRFANRFWGSIEEIEAHYAEFEQCFEHFFPALIEHIDRHGPENHNQGGFV
ncbi:ACP phosphodiesterase [Lacimicrobium alkaliphilum]|uniref:ACP phosphodiesterase n=1 Tax=Lacimicrobium alkaliphilum TaxID=1526571 RepID=A0A0U3AXK5_9ALTE|nr:ACP phosphodiesterase [Lacimicrobium alkaliphilum]ALS97616.1 ACP phosphodiesterase [Lacimicrobium alkaliphilum]